MARLFLLFLLVVFAMRLLKSLGRGSVAAPTSPPTARRRAHDILGVQPGASAADIRAAYQKAVRENHPDKVAGMSPEIRELAERRTKEINAAYEELKRKGAT